MDRLPTQMSARQGWLAPPVGFECSGETLRCALRWDGPSPKAVPAKLLFDFMALDEAPTERVAAFASRFGMLGICVHGRPFGHGLNAAAFTRGGGLGECPSLWDAWKAGLHEEDAAHWRAWARRFRLVCECVNALKQGAKTGQALDMEFVYGWRWKPNPKVRPRTVGRAALWEQVSDSLNVWLRDCDLRPAIVVDKDGKASIEMSSNPQHAFPILAHQMLLLVTGAKETPECKACGHLFLTARRPQSGRDCYCPTCGRTAANMMAARRHRAKLRARAAAEESTDGQATRTR